MSKVDLYRKPCVLRLFEQAIAKLSTEAVYLSQITFDSSVEKGLSDTEKAFTSNSYSVTKLFEELLFEVRLESHNIPFWPQYLSFYIENLILCFRIRKIAWPFFARFFKKIPSFTFLQCN